MPVDGDDAAEGADRIAGVGLHVGIGDVVADRHPARVGVLDDHACRVVETMDQAPGRFRVVEIEVAEVLAAVLRHRVPPPGATDRAIAGALLVGVLAVPQRLRPLESEVQGAGQHVGRRIAGVEPGDDRGVVGSGAGERIASEPPPRRVRQPAVLTDLGDDGLVVARIDDDADVGVVLRRRPHERRPTDVDQLDAGVGRERVQVDHDQRDRLDAVLGEISAVRLVVEVGEDAAVHLGVERHDPMAEDRREAGEVGDVGHGHTGRGDRRRGSAARDERPAQTVQCGRQLDDTRLVVDGQQRSRHSSTVAKPQ